MQQCKIFKNTNVSKLEKDINAFLKTAKMSHVTYSIIPINCNNFDKEPVHVVCIFYETLE